MTVIMSSSFQRTRDAVLPCLRAAVRGMDPTSAAMASYHLGWTDSDGRPLEADGGKSLRPALALLSAQAAGAPAEVGVPGAVAVELVHNFSLIHDDVMDRDEERRHRPTVWSIWGVPSAILTGDAMLIAAQHILLDSASPHAGAALRLLLDATRDLIGGQAEDLDFESRTEVSLEDCQEMTAGKTGALLSASAAIGAVLAGAPARTTDALARYGDHVGAAFQLVDDLLGIWGDPAVTGKPVLSDLRSGKKSLPVTYALSRGGRESRDLSNRLRNARMASEAELARMAALVEAAGGKRWAEEEAERQVRCALTALDGIEMTADVRGELTDLAEFVVARRH
jgi:geranylgeranyl diphosphate synthase, type I